MEYVSIRISDILGQLNKDTYLPAIQREFVWEPQRIESLFDSIMAKFPIGSFLFWHLKQENRDNWPIYEFIRDFNRDSPHNPPASLFGIQRDITLVLDGQQRITSLLIGLKGSYSYFRYNKLRKTRLYLNLLKSPKPNEDDPEELTYEFLFRENDLPDPKKPPQFWYLVGTILDFDDAVDAMASLEPRLENLTRDQQVDAKKLIGSLHNRVHTTPIGNYYLEKSQEYDKVLQVFVRANSGGKPLEYSDLLLSTATAQWKDLDARKEINDFTDSLNEIGTGYAFGKDFVLKASLYLTENLPIQYKVKNFTKMNLLKIQANWENIKQALSTTVRLMSRFGFHSKNIVAPLVLLPIASFLMRRGNRAFDASSQLDDVAAQAAVRKWFIFVTLKGSFGGSSDTTLNRLREVLNACTATGPFPAEELCKSLAIEQNLSQSEIDRVLGHQYQGKYTNLVLSLLYPDRDWKDVVLHEDHILPQTEFQLGNLKQRSYDSLRVESYLTKFNTLCNLQLLTDTENLSKGGTPFHVWLKTRDAAFRQRHLIPDMEDYGLDHFEEFCTARQGLIVAKLKAL